MSKENKSLSELTAEFEAVVAWFDQDEFDVEQALEKYEQAHTLSEAIKAKLTSVENKITILEKSFEA